MHHLAMITPPHTGHLPAVLAADSCLCSPAAPVGPPRSICGDDSLPDGHDL